MAWEMLLTITIASVKEIIGLRLAEERAKPHITRNRERLLPMVRKGTNP